MTFLFNGCAWNVQINLPLTLEIFFKQAGLVPVIVLSRDIFIELCVCEFCLRFFGPFTYMFGVVYLWGLQVLHSFVKKDNGKRKKINITDKSNLNSLI